MKSCSPSLDFSPFSLTCSTLICEPVMVVLPDPPVTVGLGSRHQLQIETRSSAYLPLRFA